MTTTAYNHLYTLKPKEVEAEGRRLLGDETFDIILKEGNISTKKIVEHLLKRNKLKIPAQPKQRSLFGEDYVDGKTSSAGPDK